jgi:hypothetical protein
MKFLIMFAVCMLCRTSFGQGDRTSNLTNGVPVGGLRLIFSDKPNPHSLDQMATNRQVAVNKPLVWTLHNASSNAWESVVYLGMTNSFSFQAATMSGTPISKTLKGKIMSAGPRHLNSLEGNGRVLRIHGGLMDFPALTELFEFPGNGTYVVEISYWVWDPSRKRFALSAPVRLMGIKD